jgi:hypothetical protein
MSVPTTCVQYLLNPSPRHVTSKIKINLTIIIRTTGTTAVWFTFRVRVQVEGHLHPYFLGTRITIGPRRRDETIVRVVSTEHGNLAAKCAPRRLRLSRSLVHYQREDEVRGRALGERPQGVLGPSFQGVRQLFVRFGTLAVHPDFDLLVELLEELERDVSDLQLADDVPRDERVKYLFCDVERRKVLHLEWET